MATSPSRQVVLQVGCPEHSKGLASQMKLLDGKLPGDAPHLLNQKLEMGVSKLRFAKLADDSDAHSRLRTTALDSATASPGALHSLTLPGAQHSDRQQQGLGRISWLDGENLSMTPLGPLPY